MPVIIHILPGLFSSLALPSCTLPHSLLQLPDPTAHCPLPRDPCPLKLCASPVLRPTDLVNEFLLKLVAAEARVGGVGSGPQENKERLHTQCTRTIATGDSRNKQIRQSKTDRNQRQTETKDRQQRQQPQTEGRVRECMLFVYEKSSGRGVCASRA